MSFVTVDQKPLLAGHQKLRIQVAHTRFARLIGWLSHNNAPAQQGLLLPRCRCVHTFGMRFPIDVVFLDKYGGYRSSYENIRPWSWVYDLKAFATLELPVGYLQEIDHVIVWLQSLKLGDILMDYV